MLNASLPTPNVVGDVVGLYDPLDLLDYAEKLLLLILLVETALLENEVGKL